MIKNYLLFINKTEYSWLNWTSWQRKLIYMKIVWRRKVWNLLRPSTPITIYYDWENSYVINIFLYDFLSINYKANVRLSSLWFMSYWRLKSTRVTVVWWWWAFQCVRYWGYTHSQIKSGSTSSPWFGLVSNLRMCNLKLHFMLLFPQFLVLPLWLILAAYQLHIFWFNWAACLNTLSDLISTIILRKYAHADNNRVTTNNDCRNNIFIFAV